MGFADKISEQGVQLLYNYWLGKRRSSVIPRKRDINPAELPPQLLPWMFIYRRDQGGQYRCILSGTGIALLDGQDATNHYLHDFRPAAAADSLRQMFNQTLEDGLPLYFSSRRAGSTNRNGCLARILFRNKVLGEDSSDIAQRGCSTLLLPLSGNRLSNNHILGVVMVREDALVNAGNANTRPGEHATLLQATAEDLSRRVPDAVVA